MKDGELFPCPKCKGITYNLLFSKEQDEIGDYDNLSVVCANCDRSYFSIAAEDGEFNYIEKAYVEEELREIQKDIN